MEIVRNGEEGGQGDSPPIPGSPEDPAAPTSLARLQAHRAATADADPSRRVWLFHSHAYFETGDPARVEEARAFMDHVGQEFRDNGHVEVHRFVPLPVGPHPRGSFEVLFTREVFAEYVNWLAFHRPPSISILVHPLTASQVADHTDHALWLGPVLPIRMDVLLRSDAASVASGRSEESIVDGTKRH